MKILILMTVFISVYTNAASKIEFITDKNDFFAGSSHDGRYYSKVILGQRIARKDIELDQWSQFTTEQSIHSANLSPNGQFQAWVQGTSEDNTNDVLRYYDYNLSQSYDLIYREPENGRGVISKPQFIANTNKVAVMTGVDRHTSIIFDSIIIKDIISGDETVIEPINIEPPFGFYAFVDFKISNNGDSIVYSIKNVYVAGDCCFSNPGYLVHYDVITETSTLILEQEDNIDLYSKFDYSADGSRVVFQNGEDLVLYDINNASYDNLEISSHFNSVIEWLELSGDGSVIALMGEGKFLDGRETGYSSQFIINDELAAGENLKSKPRNKVLVVKDLNNQKIDIVNKFNNYQLFESVPLSLSDDGKIVNLMTEQNTAKLYLSHEVEYEFNADAAVTGAWYDPNNPGQGMMINFAPDDEDPIGQAIVTLYTVDNSGNPFWLIMQSYFDGNHLSGDAYKVTGSQFGENFNTEDAQTSQWGVINIEFSDCNHLRLNYQPLQPLFEEGNLDLNRLSFQSGLGCL